MLTSLRTMSGRFKLELNVDVDDTAGAIVFGPAVDGEGCGVISGVGPAKDADGPTDGEALTALEGSAFHPFRILAC